MLLKSALISFCLLSSYAWAQERSIAMHFGQVSGPLGSSTNEATGWKLELVYGSQPVKSSWSVTGSIGYMNLSGPSDYYQTSPTKVQAFPLLVIPKFSAGSRKVMGYVKGMMGFSYSTSTSRSMIETTSSGVGMVLGLGVGATGYIGKRLFLSADYEWLWFNVSRSGSSAIHSTNVGLGVKF